MQRMFNAVALGLGVPAIATGVVSGVKYAMGLDVDVSTEAICILAGTNLVYAYLNLKPGL